MGNDWEPWAKIAAWFGSGGMLVALALRLLSRTFSAERVQLARDGGEVHGVVSLQKALEQCEKREERIAAERDRYYDRWQASEATVDARDESLSLLQERVRDLTRELEILRQTAYRPPYTGDA